MTPPSEWDTYRLDTLEKDVHDIKDTMWHARAGGESWQETITRVDTTATSTKSRFNTLVGILATLAIAALGWAYFV